MPTPSMLTAPCPMLVSKSYVCLILQLPRLPSSPLLTRRGTTWSRWTLTTATNRFTGRRPFGEAAWFPVRQLGENNMHQTPHGCSMHDASPHLCPLSPLCRLIATPLTVSAAFLLAGIL